MGQIDVIRSMGWRRICVLLLSLLTLWRVPLDEGAGDRLAVMRDPELVLLLLRELYFLRVVVELLLLVVICLRYVDPLLPWMLLLRLLVTYCFCC